MTARDLPSAPDATCENTAQGPEYAVDAPEDARQDAPAPRRPLGRPWVKGQPSPNPGGRPKRSVELVEASREFTAEALATLVDTMRRAKRHSTRMHAAEVILDRAWGRAPLSVSVDVAHRVALSDVSQAEWEALAVLRHAVRPALPASEAVVEVQGDVELPAEGSSHAGEPRCLQAHASDEGGDE